LAFQPSKHPNKIAAKPIKGAPMAIKFSASSSSEARAIKIVDGIEESLCDLFTTEGKPFAVTNGFVYELVRSTAKVLKAAVEKQQEDKILSIWKDYHEKFRFELFDTHKYATSMPVNGHEEVVPLMDEHQVGMLKSICPKPPEYDD
jgi:hypothetical protein